MATKGASNRYGNSRGSNGQGEPTKHIRYEWARDFNKKTLKRHLSDHGKQFGFTTVEEYGAHAVKFANIVDRVNNKSFYDKNFSTYKYNLKTNEFAIIDKKGYVITYFKPTDGYQYYLNQKKLKGAK